jgi:NNP family nitrate/nitrite transporter-like MFS transporter
VAATAGLGGGNFASSMANISFFYPDRMKGWALGLNAAGGNIGVSGVQLLTPLLLGTGLVSLYLATPTADGLYLQNAGLMWILPLAIAVVGAFLFMNNLTSARSSFKDQLAIVTRKHTWVMSYIYIGTFGSFIGYSAAFPLLIKTQFPAITVGIAFLGPLVGSLSRPLGGLLADKIGGATVTFWNFIAMGAATIGVMYFVEVKEFAGFLAMFLVLFVTTGIGNGSTYRMIPSIFREEKLREAKGSGESGRLAAIKAASIEAAAALGFIGAVGACGGYLIPRGFGASIAATGAPHLALEVFLAFYVTCIGLTWWYYLRKTLLVMRAPSLARRCIPARGCESLNARLRCTKFVTISQRCAPGRCIKSIRLCLLESLSQNETGWKAMPRHGRGRGAGGDAKIRQDHPHDHRVIRRDRVEPGQFARRPGRLRAAAKPLFPGDLHGGRGGGRRLDLVHVLEPGNNHPGRTRADG